MPTCVYLGNLSINDIEHEHDFAFSDDERALLEANWHQRADFGDGVSGWHMFDIPKFLVITDDEIGHACLDAFARHNHEYKYQFQGGYAPEGHHD